MFPQTKRKRTSGKNRKGVYCGVITAGSMLEVNNSEFTDKTELQKEFSKRVRCQKRAKFFWEAWRCERDEKNEIIQLNAQEYIDQLPQPLFI